MHFVFFDIFRRNKKLSYNRQYRYGGVMVSILALCTVDLRVFDPRVKLKTIK